MAKGNPFFGQLSGAVGDVVFSRLNGQQISRSRNRNPHNPNTAKQRYQRARMATAVEFYARGQKALFNFAFESKKQRESDFNAFIRYNVNNTPVLDPASLADGMPPIGNYVMSHGSLSPITLRYNMLVYQRPTLELAALNTTSVAQTSVGEFSRAVLAEYPYEQGDFITFVQIGTPNVRLSSDIDDAKSLGAQTGVPARLMTPFFSASVAPTWSITQVKLDINSEQSLADLNIFDTEFSNPADGQLVLGPVGASGCDRIYGAAELYACCAIASRVVGSNTMVSPAQLLLNDATQTAVALGKSEAWANLLADWYDTEDASPIDQQPKAILQGRIAYANQHGYTPAPGPTQPVVSGTLPKEIAAGQSGFDTGLRITNMGEIDATALKIVLSDGAVEFQSEGDDGFAYANDDLQIGILIDKVSGVVTANNGQSAHTITSFVVE